MVTSLLRLPVRIGQQVGGRLISVLHLPGPTDVAMRGLEVTADLIAFAGQGVRIARSVASLASAAAGPFQGADSAPDGVAPDSVADGVPAPSRPAGSATGASDEWPEPALIRSSRTAASTRRPAPGRPSAARPQRRPAGPSEGRGRPAGDEQATEGAARVTQAAEELLAELPEPVEELLEDVVEPVRRVADHVAEVADAAERAVQSEPTGDGTQVRSGGGSGAGAASSSGSAAVAPVSGETVAGAPTAATNEAAAQDPAPDPAPALPSLEIADPSAPVEQVEHGETLAHAELPLPDYDHLTVGSLRSRLRSLSSTELEQVRDYERAHANRLPVVTAIENRLARLASPS